MTKYLTGNGTVTGGVVVDSGTFDWAASGKFPSLSEPEPAYHGLKFAETFGPLAFTFHGIAIGLRDLGMTLNPQAAHYTLMGIETLSLRMARHVENATRVASWLENHPAVEAVTYAGLSSSPYNNRVARICPKGAGGSSPSPSRAATTPASSSSTACRSSATSPTLATRAAS